MVSMGNLISVGNANLPLLVSSHLHFRKESNNITSIKGEKKNDNEKREEFK